MCESAAPRLYATSLFHRGAMRLGFDDVGGDDLVQEVFLALTRRLPDVTSEEVLQVEGGKPERDEVRRR